MPDGFTPEAIDNQENLLSDEDVKMAQADVLRELGASFRQEPRIRKNLTFSPVKLGLFGIAVEREGWKYTFRRNETIEGIEITFSREPIVIEGHKKIAGIRPGVRTFNSENEILQEVRVARGVFGPEPMIEYYGQFRGKDPQKFVNTATARSKSMELVEGFKLKHLRGQT